MREQGGDWVLLPWDDPHRANVIQRSEHEAAEMKPGMRKLKDVLIEDKVARIKDVEVQSSRCIAGIPRRPSEFSLNDTERGKKRKGITIEIHLDDSIQKCPGIWCRVHRIGLINPGLQDRPLDIREPENRIPPRGQICNAIAEIRSQCDSRSHTIAAWGMRRTGRITSIPARPASCINQPAFRAPTQRREERLSRRFRDWMPYA